VSWGDDLRACREAVGLSRESLAQLAGLSGATVKAYEDGSRNPSRELLIALLDALKLERHMRNTILVGAGFAPDGFFLGPSHLPDFMFSLDEAIGHIAGCPWPAFIVNEYMELVGANEVCLRLWDIDLQHEFPPGIGRNMLSVASTTRFAERMANWDDLVRLAISIFKGHYRGAEDLEQASPYFAEVMQRYAQGEPRFVARFAELWLETPPLRAKVRLMYQAVWREPGVGDLRFQGLTTTANEADGLAFNDWIPVDAETWECLGRLRLRRG
jgi:transcriptional regulator with XRE-family HTH domain